MTNVKRHHFLGMTFSLERESRLRTDEQTRPPAAETANNPKIFPLFFSLSSTRGCGKKSGEL
jgi:hypothetical protein